MSEVRPGLRRKFVGSCPEQKYRRDFVRIQGEESNTCLSTELLVFVVLSGFVENSNDGFVLSPSCRNTVTNPYSVEFALVRWLSPHPNTFIRDSKLRPICTPPLDINHALWTYAQRPANRDLKTNHTMFYNGNNQEEQALSLQSESRAFFDLIQPDSFVGFINCTPINTSTETGTLLETITLPFEETAY